MNEPAKIQEEEKDIELEIVDDTPEEDRKPPKNESVNNIPEDNEISNLSKNAQDRIKKLKYEYHEERRAKEQAEKLQEESVNFSNNLLKENQDLKKKLEEGETVLIDQAKSKVDSQLEVAKAKYKAAYEEGDPDKIIEAQQEITNITNEKFRVDNYKPQHKPVKETEYKQEQKPKPQVSQRAKDWGEKNKWFNDDDEMTGYALGLHQKLLKQGVPSDSDMYYDAIDKEIRKRFPDKFDEQIIEEAPVQQTGSVVAPALRSAKKPRRVQLTSTQVSLARRLGLTPEQYAAQLLKETSNG